MPRKTYDLYRLDPHEDRASMRPRPDAAENHVKTSIRHGNVPASMRPRPDAAENPSRPRRCCS